MRSVTFSAPADSSAVAENTTISTTTPMRALILSSYRLRVDRYTQSERAMTTIEASNPPRDCVLISTTTSAKPHSAHSGFSMP